MEKKNEISIEKKLFSVLREMKKAVSKYVCETAMRLMIMTVEKKMTICRSKIRSSAQSTSAN